MPKSVQDIIDSADELAKKFEAMQPDADGSPALAAVHRGAVARSRSEAELAQAVDAARAEGRSWAQIAVFLGISGEAARPKYGRRASA
ncbi:MAG: hypothetical protein WCP28_12985 [Actinomycetes bacterium]